MGVVATSDPQHKSVLPKLQLDELLAEVQGRLDAVRASHAGVRALLDAVVAIGRELELETVLRRIVEAAKSLVDARYAALGVIGEDRQLAEFIPLGLTEDQIAEIEQWPHGRGILGLLIKEPQTLLLGDISEHPESYGFPRGHPPMKRFLGVPLRIRDEVFGNLYLTDKINGSDFDEQDAAIVSALAAAAGVAIDNARLYEETRAREVWLEASGEVTRELLSGAASRATLQLVARRAREMAHAETALIVLPEGDERLTVAAVDGTSADALTDFTFPREGTLSSSVISTGESRVIADLRKIAERGPIGNRLPSGPAAFVPLSQPERTRGVLAVHRRVGGIPFTPEMVNMLAAFASQVAVVMELADARREAERYGLIDDRARIARDLHDLVIQRLFASAMALTGTTRLVDDRPVVAERVQRVVRDLDETIGQIRSSIFALQTTEQGHDSRLRARIINVVDSATDRLGFAPGVQLNGLLDTEVSEEVAEHAIAVLQEALSNAVRHASASRVDVVVQLADDRLTVQVTDDGVGLTNTNRRSGLANLAERAEQLQGTFEINRRPEGGTSMQWTVPA